MATHRIYEYSRPSWDSDEEVFFKGTGVAPVASVAASSDRVFRGVFLPAFEFDVCITVSLRGDGGEVEVAHLDLQDRARFAALMSKGKQEERDIFVPRVVHAPLDFECAASIAQTIDALDRDALAVRPSLGLDGMLLRGAIAGDGAPFHFTAWSPTAARQPVLHGYFAALCRLAVEALDGAEVRSALERLHLDFELSSATHERPRSKRPWE